MRRGVEHTLTILALTLALALPGLPALANPVCVDQIGPSVTMAEVGQGELLYRTGEPGRFVAAPLQSTVVDITVRGLVARARVAQEFENPSTEWLEGVYVFPLPAEAAVDHMQLVVGERIIEGQIKEREQARKVYEQAKSEGRKASLVEQERPNIFTTSVANIGPGEVVAVVIEYQQAVPFDEAGYRLRFPMVVGPRFIPGDPTGAGESGLGWGPNTDQVPDAERVTPPVVPPGHEPVNPVQLRVSLDMGLPLAKLVSPYHTVVTSRPEGTRYELELDGDVVADRDFALEWAVAAGREPRAAVFTEELDGEYYVLAMVVPPDEGNASEVRLPRETVLVIDTSGSMHGASIVQARKSLLYALDRLQPDDYFNVIQFNSGMSMLFTESRQAFPATVDRAREWVSRLQAGGGTVMLPAVEAALDDRLDAATVRQVVFVTDGCVGNEDQLFAVISRDLGRSRLFTVGIGSAPNSHFMERAARFGKGTFTYVGDPSEVGAKMGELFAKLENPVLTDLELRWPDAGAEQWPERIPDLYAGEPVVVAVRAGTIAGDLVVTGRRGQEAWEVELPLEVGQLRAGVHQLWARRKIAALMDEATGGAEQEQVRAAVVDVALRHHLVSRYTSLVAVDVTPSRPRDIALDTAAVPTNLPAGWSHEAVFGTLPQGGTGSTAFLLCGLVLVALGMVFRLSAAPAERT